jgi:hypothetical protein
MDLHGGAENPTGHIFVEHQMNLLSSVSSVVASLVDWGVTAAKQTPGPI